MSNLLNKDFKTDSFTYRVYIDDNGKRKMVVDSKDIASGYHCEAFFDKKTIKIIEYKAGIWDSKDKDRISVDGKIIDLQNPESKFSQTTKLILPSIYNEILKNFNFAGCFPSRIKK